MTAGSDCHDVAESDPIVLTSAAGSRLSICPHSGDLLCFQHPSGGQLTGGRAPAARVGLRARGAATVQAYTTDNAGQADVRTSPGGVEAQFTDWTGCDLSMTVRVRSVAEGFAWTGEVQVGGDLSVEWLELPGVVVPHDLTGSDGDGRIVWPFAEGVLVDSLETRDQGWLARAEPEYPSRPTDSIFPSGICSQFIAHYNRHGGLLLAAHDRTATPKMIDYGQVDGGIELVMRTYAAGSAGGYGVDFDTVLSHFDGGWHGAAEGYRTWFDGVTELTPLGERDDLPRWYFESPLVVTYPVRGSFDRDEMSSNKMFPYVDAMPHVERIAGLTGVPVMALLMHWEGTAPWAPPFVWPPFGGAESLAQFAEHLHAGGHLLGLYCSGIGWTQQSHLIEYDRSADFDSGGWAEVMCRAPDGSLPASRVCTNQRNGYDLCPAHPRVLSTMRAELESMLEVGTDYVQLYDQNTGGHSFFCYDTEHGHGYGPGRWQTEHSLRVQRELAELARSHGALLGAEFGAAEPYIETLPLNDLRFEAGYAIGTPIPIYQYLYHHYLTNFMGNQVATHHFLDHDSGPDDLLYRLAYAVHAGELLTLNITDAGEVSWNWGSRWASLPEQEPVLHLVATLSRWRQALAAPYLSFGRMLAPRPHASESRPIRLSMGTDLPVDQVLVSRWEAPDGSRVEILINWTKDEAYVTLAAETPESIVVIDDPANPAGPRIGGHRLTIPPLSVRVLLDAAAVDDKT